MAAYGGCWAELTPPRRGRVPGRHRALPVLNCLAQPISSRWIQGPGRQSPGLSGNGRPGLHHRPPSDLRALHGGRGTLTGV
eukprot:9720442-Heterocapsa_arctica.AAC.1